MKEVMRLGVYCINPQAILPSFATEGSACFDISACLEKKTTVKCYEPIANKLIGIDVQNDTITIHTGMRVMVPTGLIFEIPTGHSVRLHPRSGLALKNGIVLVNQEAVIDADYVQETFVLLENKSYTPFVVHHGMRICQGELIENVPTKIQETHVAPIMKERTGGFGSTGVN